MSAEVLSSWPYETPRETNRLREIFLMQPHADLSGIRPMVARSWYRSRAAGVDAFADRGFYDEGRVDEYTIAAAGTHLRKLDEVAADLGGYVNITAPNGVLVKASFLRDDGFPAGYSLLEESCGSNGEGLALEEGRGVWLAPEEHFREDMRGNWCFASLVRDPFHNRVRAVIGLTLPANRVSTLEPSSTLLMLEGVASRIERDIEVRTSSKERALLSEYLRVSRRRGNRAVIAVDGKNALQNASATATLVDSDFSVVCGYAKAVMSSGRDMNCEVMLQGPGLSTLEIAPVSLSSANVGAIVVVRPHAPAKERSNAASGAAIALESAPKGTAERLLKHVDGTSTEFKRTLNLAQKAVDQDRSVVMFGEVGSGKLRLAGAIAALRGGQMVVDARNGDLRNTSLRDILHRVATELPSTLIVEHADELSQNEASEIARNLQGIAATRLIFTITRPTEATLLLSEAFDVLEISVAPLRNRREDIPQLANAIAKELGERKLSRRLITTLTHADWPRNIDQLRAVVSNAVERAEGAEVTLDDLPQGFHRVLTKGRLSRLEDAELSELRTALQEAGGNRSLAAETLQIGRSTLYRRMDYFRSRGFDL
ncbi:sigma-54-dependent Fis family transcriptional regulator [Paenarthrobacter sp. JL.01a]|uniref:sigma-54-dependent Fis family transcriptional regulator n=1 Tax=Paenarthrobacter sp. JL.01a TaxID=2979324 RepID=UPI0021C6FF82|nr:helix-turn-helix domain-containing protein [Paenarthrobacter sp. JL.01a]UXM91920.1 dynein regulation protein LC7 [Paenarthrobacter sp. JL.01a]